MFEEGGVEAHEFVDVDGVEGRLVGPLVIAALEARELRDRRLRERAE